MGLIVNVKNVNPKPRERTGLVIPLFYYPPFFVHKCILSTKNAPLLYLHFLIENGRHILVVADDNNTLLVFLTVTNNLDNLAF